MSPSNYLHTPTDVKSDKATGDIICVRSQRIFEAKVTNPGDVFRYLPKGAHRGPKSAFLLNPNKRPVFALHSSAAASSFISIDRLSCDALQAWIIALTAARSMHLPASVPSAPRFTFTPVLPSLFSSRLAGPPSSAPGAPPPSRINVRLSAMTPAPRGPATRL